jgi:Cu/Ag efflux protein CusF
MVIVPQGCRCWRRWRGVGLAVLLLVGAAGCRKGETAGAQADKARRYTVRGEVVRAADPARRDGEILVRHEAITDFTDRGGRVVGMAPMVMPFVVEPAALAQGFAVGDKVEIRFAVDWSVPLFRVEHIAKLPAATQLRFQSGGAQDRARAGP